MENIIEIYDKYSQLAFEKKRIEEQMDNLKPLILSNMDAEGLKTNKLPFGTFSLRTTKTWKYSEKVEQAADEVKQLKKLEEESGSASCEENTTLQFKGNI